MPKLINKNNFESIINEEKLIIEEIMNVLNNFDKIFNDTFKKDLNFNDINIQTNIDKEILFQKKIFQVIIKLVIIILN